MNPYIYKRRGQSCPRICTSCRAKNLLRRNLGLVHACAGRFKGRGIEYEELYAAGCLGLVKACDGFDTGRGVCFSTYAVPVILGEIKSCSAMAAQSRSAVR